MEAVEKLETAKEEAALVRRAGPGDVAVVLELLREHYGEGHDVAARHEWLYRQNPHGEAVTFLAFDRATKTPAGLTSLFPRKVWVEGEKHLGSIGGDGYVRPRFRRRGIATALHRACLQSMGPGTVELMYGPPEPHNLAALVRAGSKVVCQLRRFVRPLDARRLARLGLVSEPLSRLLRPKRSPLRLRAVEPNDLQGIDRIWSRAAPDLDIAPIRDSRFYDWRYLRCPGGKQRAFYVMDGERRVGLCAIERNGKRTVIVDIVSERRNYEAMIDAICFHCAGDEAIEIRLNERGPIAALLWRKGFVPRDRKAFQVLVDAKHPSARKLYRPQAWYYTTGDGDVVSVL